MKRKVLVVLILMLGVLCSPAEAVVITPSNIVMPTLPGDTFSFDLIIDDSMGVTVVAFQSTLSVSGAGLTFDTDASEAVTTDPDYWIVGNSIGALAQDQGSNIYMFGDGPENPPTEALVYGDIMARYVFTWDGTESDYTFTLDLNTLNSFVLNADTFATDALEFTSGDYTGDAGSFTVAVPEPTTLALLTLGGLILKRRRA